LFFNFALEYAIRKVQENQVKVKLSLYQAMEAYMFETLRLPHFQDSWLTDGEVVTVIHWPPFTPRKIPSTHFC
jgi:hypothetical protein